MLQRLGLGEQLILALLDPLLLGLQLLVRSGSQPAIQLSQPPPLGPELFLVLQHLALGGREIAGDLLDVLLVGQPILLQRLPLGLGPFVQGLHLAAFVVEEARQLLLLAFEGGFAMLQAGLFLAQRALLGGDGGRLQTQSVPVALGELRRYAVRGLIGHGQAARRQMQAELKGADREQIAVLEVEALDPFAVDEGALGAVEIADHQAAGAMHEQAVHLADVRGVEANVAPGRLADEGERHLQGPAHRSAGRFAS